MNDPIVRQVKDGLYLPEGPRWHEGRLYFSDMLGAQVMAVDERGHCETICTVPGRPSGLGFTTEGDLLIVSMSDRQLLRLYNGQLIQAADMAGHADFPCNDMIVDPQGRAYVGSVGWDMMADETIHGGDILLIRDGQASIAARDLSFPNGMALSADGGTLLVAETYASRISAFERGPDGALSNRRVWASLSSEAFSTTTRAHQSGSPLPDGIALDAEGALWIADAGGNAALRVAEGGEILGRIETGGLAVYAVAFGGHDGRTLFLCAAPTGQFEDRKGVILACDLEVGAAPEC